jgi:hypothetical protein
VKTISKKQFRVLLTLCLAAFIASVIAGALDAWLLPKQLLDYERSQHGIHPTNGELIASILGAPGTIAAFVSLIGLYCFWPPARWLAAAAWAYLLVWMPFSPGPVVTNTLCAALTACFQLLAGAVLALVYFSPAADWFRKKSGPEQSPQ